MRYSEVAGDDVEWGDDWDEVKMDDEVWWSGVVEME